MAAAKGSSRTRMIEATETLLRERGLAGAGIKSLVARSGAPIGSVYHFFPGGKTQLVAETLQIHSSRALRLFQQAFADDATPLPSRLRALFRMAASGFDQAGADKSCAIANVTLDLEPGDQELRDICRRSFDQWAADITGHVPGASDEIRRSFARMIVIALEGAFIIARAERSGRAFLTTGEWLARLAELPALQPPEKSHASSTADRRRGPRRLPRVSRPRSRANHD